MTEFEIDLHGREITVVCPNCNGTGGGDGVGLYGVTIPTTCSVCGGDGEVSATGKDTILEDIEPQRANWP